MDAPLENYLCNIWRHHVRHRTLVLQALVDSLTTETRRQRQKGDKWSIEELTRHVLYADEWWLHIFLLGNRGSLESSIGIENDTQATNWVTWDIIQSSFTKFDNKFLAYLANLQPEERVIRPKFQMDTSLGWVVYHLIQHEAESWGMVAERVRRLGQPTPWEF